MNIGNVTSDSFNLDYNGKEMQKEVYEQLIDQLQQENKQLKDSWNELKKDIGYELLKLNDALFNAFTYINNKMQELERSD